ncbi:MAG: hypothetical protein ACREQ5_17055, partial [Candidatus Dormibacteria bacterium]
MALLGAALVALALVVAAAAAFALVGFLSHALPPPSGPYPVGTLLLPFEFGSAAPQRLAQVWYPTVARGTSAYAPGEPGLRGWYHRLIRTAAATGAAPARLANEPLVVYVPAWGGHRWENTALASELASYGYVVAALD